ncbi:hypothetical protein BDK92_7175 [Micromonospora pisi]|uniref:DeoxyPurine in DNA protein A domain-containing protein n=1 Tax=Micromonospora pisi TaxID=589240 RepID=A0A495JUK6_9ACTN|nr:hypothetical protein [Micromonospora pisi]RKR92697.1 hypothetical protein BDK92_7175 [Micromonospora pisi]
MSPAAVGVLDRPHRPGLPPETGDEAADLAAFLAWEADEREASRAAAAEYHRELRRKYGLRPEPATMSTEWGELTNPTIDRDDPARRLTYYLGAHHPSWLNYSPVPLFISAASLARYRTTGDRWPVRMGMTWALDSGAFTALTPAGIAKGDAPWWQHPDEYGGMATRFAEEVGPPDFCAPQDWPCEPPVRERTGMTVREHQQLTLDNFLYLREEFYFLPWIPVLQGWEADEYLEHAEMYEAAGVDLAAAYRVGVGSICRRGHVPSIVRVIEQFASRGYRMHGFGVKVTALPLIGHLFASADSMAWSDTARRDRIRLPECTHRSKSGELSDCRNCFRWALRWRERVLESLRSGRPARSSQLALF